MTSIRIGSRGIGVGFPCFLAAEIGINHNGNIDLAKKTIEAAKESGADAVKFQNYRTEDFISDRTVAFRYVSQGQTVTEPQYEMFKRYELNREQLTELKQYCDRQNIVFHSTPTSESGVQDLVKLGVTILKNGSDCLNHLSLIRAMGKTMLPTVISTGMGTLEEIEEAVRTFHETGNDQLILLHCVTSYPTPPKDVHLRKIPTLATIFHCPVGFSDHTDGIIASVGAVAMGACWVEKHFTLDKNLPGPDHRFSADPAEFTAMVKAVRELEYCLGDSRVGPTEAELKSRRMFRLSCVAAHDLQIGHILSDQDIALQRPGKGFAPNQKQTLIGKKLNRAVEAGHALQLSDFE